MARPRPVAAFLAHLPVCRKWRLPVPYSSGTDATGAGQFGINDPAAKLACGVRRLCGICGQALDGEIVFLVADAGVPLRRPVFPDPGNHERCAVEATVLCPHIARRGRSSPPGWLMWVTTSYELVPGRKALADFLPGPALRLRLFAYDQTGALVET